MNRPLRTTHVPDIRPNFKNEQVEKDWGDPRLNPIVKNMVQWSVNWLYRSTGYRATLTEIYREPRHPSDVHAYWRGVDMRANDLPLDESLKIENTADQMWQYDPKRPERKVCYLHNVTPNNSDNLHFHWQCHPNTVVRVTDADLEQGEREFESLTDEDMEV